MRHRGLLEGGDGSTIGTQSHIPFTRSQVVNSTAFPQRTHGRLFIRTGAGAGWCSATVVVSSNGSVIFTAAHCLHSGGSRGEFVRSAIFVPAYRDGARPFGVFPARAVGVTRQWAGSGNLNFDIGAVVLGRNGNNRRVQPVVGARGIAWNQPRDFFFRAFGYPSNFFRGERPFVCNSRFGGLEREQRPGPAPSVIGCDMRRGSSGGGWVVQDDFVNSVISRFDTTAPHLTGPYFGLAARKLWSQANRR